MTWKRLRRRIAAWLLRDDAFIIGDAITLCGTRIVAGDKVFIYQSSIPSGGGLFAVAHKAAPAMFRGLKFEARETQ